MDRCDDCGFVYDTARCEEAGRAITAGVAELAAELRSSGTACTSRPAPEVWSPLEYACHVRDLLLVQRERVLVARRVDLPSFHPMGRDERVDHEGYRDQEPDDVLRQLIDAATLFANVLDRLDEASWDRRLVYNHPQRAERDLRWVAVHTWHEVQHHLLDVRRGLGRL